MKKKLFAMALCLLMVVAMAVPAFAELRYTSNTTVENYKVKFIAEPNGVYGIALVNRPNWVALTESSVQTVGGHNVVWQPSSGLNNQLWRGVLVYD